MPKWKLSALMMLLPLAASAQGGPDSVSKHFRRFVASHTKILIDAAEAMPADKYGFKPTPAQWTFGKIIAHMAGDNRITCSAIAGAAADKSQEPSATASKEELVSALKSSLTFCEGAVAKVNDGMLGDSVSYYGQRATRVSPLIGLVEDWSDHYSQLAGYLRLNNVLPPTAKNGGM
jgi:DinB family protein